MNNLSMSTRRFSLERLQSKVLGSGWVEITVLEMPGRNDCSTKGPLETIGYSDGILPREQTMAKCYPRRAFCKGPTNSQGCESLWVVPR